MNAIDANLLGIRPIDIPDSQSKLVVLNQNPLSKGNQHIDSNTLVVS